MNSGPNCHFRANLNAGSTAQNFRRILIFVFVSISSTVVVPHSNKMVPRRKSTLIKLRKTTYLASLSMKLFERKKRSNLMPTFALPDSGSIESHIIKQIYTAVLWIIK